MKQLIQNYRSGELEVADVPSPVCTANTIIVRTLSSLVSIGTERSIIELGRKSLLGKARARPDLLKRFIEKSHREGLGKTFQEAMRRLDNPIALGYSSSGIVTEVGENATEFSPGDRVACIGAGYASHAEFVLVPPNLCCALPTCVPFEAGSFGMLGIIALHGIRTAQVSFGESVVVIGLGLLGLITCQILSAYGCVVIGMDIDRHKVELATRHGLEYGFDSYANLQESVARITKGHGVDAVIITAAASKSSKPMDVAVDIVRFGGSIVVVGVVDIHPQRNELWHKEVRVVVSKAGGPGSLDPIYENKGIDYPIGIARWTERRNLEEFFRLITSKRVDVQALITHRTEIAHADQMYKAILAGEGGPHIGVVIEYASEGAESAETLIHPNRPSKHVSSSRKIGVGVIGAGVFGKALLLPALAQNAAFQLRTIATAKGMNAYHTGAKYKFERYSTDYHDVLADSEIDAVVILTPHSQHARMVTESLQAGKAVFVEKPLCVNQEELDEIVATVEQLGDQCPSLLVGYNRRFSPHAVRAKALLAERKDPLVLVYRVNAGFVHRSHWVHSEEQGGSRVIGEMCHFVDFMQFLTGALVVEVAAKRISGNDSTAVNSDNVATMLSFDDGSIGTLAYSAQGDRSFSRERVEVFADGKTYVIDDFANSETYEFGRHSRFKTGRQHMGYAEEIAEFASGVRETGNSKLSFREIHNSTQTVFCIKTAMGTGTPVAIKPLRIGAQLG